MKLQDLKPLNEVNLLITKEHGRQARGNKQNFVVTMDPELFLKLTTHSYKEFDDIVSDAKSTEEYNAFADSGDNIIMPFLDIEGGKIRGHEGRHRAGSLIKGGETYMPVAIKYRSGDAEEEKELADKYGTWKVEYLVDMEDLPNVVSGQYGQGTLTKNDMKYGKHLQK